MNWQQTTTIRFGTAYMLSILTLFLTACWPSFGIDYSGVQPETQLSLYNDAVDGCAMSGKWKGAEITSNGDPMSLWASVDVIDLTAPNPVVRAALYVPPNYACGYERCYDFFEGSLWLVPGRQIVLERPPKFGTPHMYLELDESGRSMKFWFLSIRTNKVLEIWTKKVGTNECGVPDDIVEAIKQYQHNLNLAE